jgi:hypothetical protein
MRPGKIFDTFFFFFFFEGELQKFTACMSTCPNRNYVCFKFKMNFGYPRRRIIGTEPAEPKKLNLFVLSRGIYAGIKQTKNGRQ